MPWELIPQIFYDLLARLVPGVVVLLLVLAVAIGPAALLAGVTSPTSPLSSAGAVAPLLLGGYLTGLMLGEGWAALPSRLTRRTSDRVQHQAKAARVHEHQRMQGRLGVNVLALTVEDLPPLFVMLDHLRAVTAPDAARLLKIEAERRLCHVLFLSSVVLASVNAIRWLAYPSADRAALEAILVVIAATSWSRDHRLAEHFANGTTVAWLVAASSGRLPLQAPKAQ